MSDEFEKSQKRENKKLNNEKADYYSEKAVNLENVLSEIKKNLNKLNVEEKSNITSSGISDIVNYKYATIRKSAVGNLKKYKKALNDTYIELTLSLETIRNLEKKYRNAANSITID